MMISLLTQYPELSLAILALVVVLVTGFGFRGRTHSGQWFMDPALACLMLLPDDYVSWLTRMLRWADWRGVDSLGVCASVKVYPALLSLFAGLVVPWILVPAVVVVMFFLPDLILCICVRKRHSDILNSLPQALDLMVLCVDAGLGLDATLKRIASDTTVLAQALNEELSSLGRDVLLGMDRERAYQELYNRTGVDELRSLGSALNQSGKLGLSIARILRAQSEFMRVRQSQRVEERALKLPVYMAFPLWFCIMPALMLIVLGPSLILFFRNLGSN